MTLHDKIAEATANDVQMTDEIVAVVREYLTSDEALKRAGLALGWIPLEGTAAEKARAAILAALEGADRCPTCEGTGPDAIDRDFDSGMDEAACGDEWHDAAPEGADDE
jgi:hypothetical protein